MAKQVRIPVAILFVAILCAIGWRVLHSTEPEYRGKPLSFWLEGYRVHNLGGPEQKNADDAISHTGTNSIPTLLKMARAHDSALKLRVRQWAQKQHFIKIDYVSASERNIQAVYGFQKLGSKGKDAVPALIALCEQNISRTTREAIPAALGWIGPEAKQAIPVLLPNATNANPFVRGNAIYALGQISW